MAASKPRGKKGKSMLVDTHMYTCEVCGRKECPHCQECGSPGEHATTCSLYVSKHTRYHQASGRTFTLTVRSGLLLRLQELTQDFPLVWSDVPTSTTDGLDWWKKWQNSIDSGLFDYNIN